MRRKSDAEKRLAGTFRRDRREALAKPPGPRRVIQRSVKGASVPFLAVRGTPVPVGKPPKGLSPVEKQEWVALSEQLGGRVPPGQKNQFSYLVRASARLKDSTLSSSAFTHLMATCARMLASLQPAPEAFRPETLAPFARVDAQASDAPSVQATATDDDPFAPLPKFTRANYPELFAAHDLPPGRKWIDPKYENETDGAFLRRIHPDWYPD
jgi:hypothetical protein